jgi:hypothetical protein
MVWRFYGECDGIRLGLDHCVATAARVVQQNKRATAGGKERTGGLEEEGPGGIDDELVDPEVRVPGVLHGDVALDARREVARRLDDGVAVRAEHEVVVDQHLG